MDEGKRRGETLDLSSALVEIGMGKLRYVRPDTVYIPLRWGSGNLKSRVLCLL